MHPPVFFDQAFDVVCDQAESEFPAWRLPRRRRKLPHARRRSRKGVTRVKRETLRVIDWFAETAARGPLEVHDVAEALGVSPLAVYLAARLADIKTRSEHDAGLAWVYPRPIRCNA